MRFNCQSCNAKYQIADEKVSGKTVRMKCRKCEGVIQVRSRMGPQGLEPVYARPSVAPAAPGGATGRRAPAPAPPAKRGLPAPRASSPGAPPRARPSSPGGLPRPSNPGGLPRPSNPGVRPAPAPPRARPSGTLGAPRPGGPPRARPSGTLGGPAAPPRARPSAPSAPAAKKPLFGADEDATVVMMDPRVAEARAALEAKEAAARAKPVPPVSDEPEWYVGIEGEPVGPVDVAFIKQQIDDGKVNGQSLVWREELTDWKPLGSFDELARMLPPAPVPAGSDPIALTRAKEEARASRAEAQAAEEKVRAEAAEAEAAAREAERRREIEDAKRKEDAARAAEAERAEEIAAAKAKADADRKSQSEALAAMMPMAGSSHPGLPEPPVDSARGLPRAAGLSDPGLPSARASDPGLPSAGSSDPGLPGAGSSDPGLPGAGLPGAGLAALGGASRSPEPPGGDAPGVDAARTESAPKEPGPEGRPSADPPVNALALHGTDALGAPDAAKAPEPPAAPESIPPDSEELRAAGIPGERRGRRRGINPLAYALIAMATAFGGVAAWFLFGKTDTPQAVAQGGPQVLDSAGNPVPGPAGSTSEAVAKEPGPDGSAITVEDVDVPSGQRSGTWPPGKKSNGNGTESTPDDDDGGSTATKPAPPKCTDPDDPFCNNGPSGPTNDSSGSGASESGSPLSPSQVSSTVSKFRGSLMRRCRSLVTKGNAKVSASIRVAPSGAVSSVSASGGGGVPGLTSCVQSRIANWRFPTAGASTTVNVSFNFLSG